MNELTLHGTGKHELLASTLAQIQKAVKAALIKDVEAEPSDIELIGFRLQDERVFVEYRRHYYWLTKRRFRSLFISEVGNELKRQA